MIEGHRLSWGLTADQGRDTGWSAIASSIDLSESAFKDLADLTAVGRVEERSAEDGVGYFGETIVSGEQYAVFAHFYRSLRPDATGHHFVQRDIFLAPHTVFRKYHYDTGAFLRAIPEPHPYTKGERLDPWSLDDGLTSRFENPDELQNLAGDLLLDLLTACVQESPTEIVSTRVHRFSLSDLLLLLPPVLRRRVTYATLIDSVDEARTVRLRITRSLQPNTDGAIIDLDRKQVRQRNFTVSSSVPEMVVSLWKDTSMLERYNSYVDHWADPISDYSEVLKSSETADAAWRSRRALEAGFAGDDGDIWTKASGYLELLHTAPLEVLINERAWVFQNLIERVESSDDIQSLGGFLKTQSIDARKRHRDVIVKQSGIRMASLRKPKLAGQLFTRIVEIDRDAAPALVAAFLDAIPEDQRTLDRVAAVQRALEEPFSAEALTPVLRGWSFESEVPAWNSVRELLRMVRTTTALDHLWANETARSRLRNSAKARFACYLLRERLGSHLPPFDFSELPAEEAADVFLDPATQLDRVPPLVVARTGSQILVNGSVSLDRQIAQRALAALEELSRSREERDVNWIPQFNELLPHLEGPERDRLLVAQMRLEMPLVMDSPADVIRSVVERWEVGLPMTSLIAVIEPRGDVPFESSEMLWHLVARLYEEPEFPFDRFTREAGFLPNGLALVRMIAMVGLARLAAKGRERRLLATLAECFRALSTRRLILRPTIDHYVPDDPTAEELELAASAFGFALGPEAAIILCNEATDGIDRGRRRMRLATAWIRIVQRAVRELSKQLGSVERALDETEEASIDDMKALQTTIDSSSVPYLDLPDIAARIVQRIRKLTAPKGKPWYR